MSIDAIKEVRDATPFRPFVVRTADGRAFQVPNHDSLLVTDSEKTIIVVTADQRFHILAADRVSSVTR